jgi:hypothetical protein
MTNLLTPAQTIIYLVVFAVTMLFITTFFGRKIGSKTVDGFLVVDRNGTCLPAEPRFALRA